MLVIWSDEWSGICMCLSACVGVCICVYEAQMCLAVDSQRSRNYLTSDVYQVTLCSLK